MRRVLFICIYKSTTTSITTITTAAAAAATMENFDVDAELDAIMEMIGKLNSYSLYDAI